MAKNSIEIEHLTFRYNEEQSVPTIDDLSLKIEEGKWVSLVGHNGSGKSTLAKLIDGLLDSETGRIVVSGKTLNEESLWEVRDKIGIVFQNPDNQFVGATVEDDVAFGLENKGIPREEMILKVRSALEEVGMWELREREPSTLSGGQKQRVALAGIIAIEPEVMILDEATSMLDPEGRKEVMETIHQLREKKKMTILSITHDLSEVVDSDEVIVLNHGKILETGTPAEIFSYGEKLIEMGLDFPFTEKLKRQFIQKGYSLPEHYLSEKELVDELWKYNYDM